MCKLMTGVGLLCLFACASTVRAQATFQETIVGEPAFVDCAGTNSIFLQNYQGPTSTNPPTDLDNDNGIHYGLPWLTPGASGGNWLWPTDPKNYYGLASDRADSGTGQATASHIHRFGPRSQLRTALRVAHYTRDQRASAIRFAAAADQPGGQGVTADTFDREKAGIHLKRERIGTTASG